MEQQLADQFLELRQDGNQLLHKILSEWLEGEVSIWDPIRRRKLPSFQTNAKTINMKLKDQVVTLTRGATPTGRICRCIKRKTRD